MEAVIKVGGSLAEDPSSFNVLCSVLAEIATEQRVLVVPGGGQFADVVRQLDAQLSLPSLLSHQLAILAMDQYGLLLSHFIPKSRLCYSLKDARRLSDSERIPILLPSRLLNKHDPFVPSWEVTSDSIAAFIANELSAAKAIFVTDVDGILTDDPKKNPKATVLSTISVKELLELKKRTSVDKFLPRLLLERPIDCYVVSGKHPHRIKAILRNLPTVCTRISVS